MSEKRIMNKIQMALAGFGARIFRNQVGRYKLPDDNWISYGLGPGSSDLIGWTTVQIKSDMVGRKIAVFTAIEVKTPKGRVTPQQENFIRVVRVNGGIGFVARSTEEAVEKLFKGSDLSNGTGL